MKIGSVLSIIFWGMLFLQPARTQRGQVKSVKGIFLLSVHVAFEQFRRDMAKEGFLANLADYSIEYQQLIHGYKEHSRALRIEIQHIKIREEWREKPYAGYKTGQYGIFIVDIDTQEIIEKKYFE